MAKNTQTETALVPGSINPTDVGALLADGFSEARIISIGVKEGKVPAYIGMLVGAGIPMEFKDDHTGEVSRVPTYAFKPVVDGSGKVQENVTNVIPAPHQLNQALSRILATAEKMGKRALVAIAYNGQVDTRRGQRVNDYRICEKYV